MTALLAGLLVLVADPASPLTAIDTSPDGKVILVGSKRGLSTYRQDAATDRSESSPTGVPIPLKPLSVQGLPRAIHDLAFNHDGTHVAVVGGEPAQTGLVVVLTWPDARVVHRVEVGTDVLFDVEWIGDRLVVASLDGTARVIESNEVTQVYSGHSRGVTSVVRVNDGIVATGSLDATIRVWSRETGTVLRTLSQHGRPVSSLAVRAKNDGPVLLASASGDRTIRFWHPETGRMLRFARVPSPPLDLAWVSETHVAVGCHDGHVRVIDFETVEIVDDRVVADCPVHSVTFRGGRLFAGRADGRLIRLRVGD